MMNSAISTSAFKSHFHAHLIELNHLAKKGFSNWAFYPGMLFNSLQKWWGDFGKRKTRHEGLDLCFFMDQQKNTHRLAVETYIPAMFDGILVAFIDDYLGKSIIMDHGIKASNNVKFITIYGHTIPDKKLHAGDTICAGDCIATLADTRGSLSGLPPHLHISAGWLPVNASSAQLNWDRIADPKILKLVNPLDLFILKNRYALMDEAHNP